MIKGQRFYNQDPDLARNAAILAGKEVPEEGVAGGAGGGEPQYAYNKLWEKVAEMKSTPDKPYELLNQIKSGKYNDEPLTPEKEYELLLNELKPEPVREEVIPNDPFIYQYLEEKERFRKENPDKEFTTEDFISKFNKEMDVMKMDDDSLITAVLKKSEKNPDGFDEVDIKEHLAKMDKIEKHEKALKYRDQIKKQQDERANAALSKLKEIDKVKIAKLNENLDKLSSTTILKFQKVDKIGSLPHGESERKSFEPYFKQMTQVNPETGRMRVLDFLDNDEMLYKALYLLRAAETGSMDNFITAFKEDFKKSVLDKTGLSGKGPGAGGAIELPENVNPKQFV